MDRRRHRAGGFTLVELLVVIGIIGVLIGILLPALGRARLSAQTVACKSNLRQIALAATMFANEHGGYLPKAENNGAPVMQGWATRVGSRWEFADNMWAWEWALLKYAGRNRQVFRCPADPEPRTRYLWNDTMSNLGGENSKDDNVPGSYRYNWSNEILESGNGSPPNLSSNYNGTRMVSPKLSQMKPSERAILFMDGANTLGDGIAFQGTQSQDLNHVNLKRDMWSPVDGTVNVRQNNPYNVAFRRHSKYNGRWESMSQWDRDQALKKGTANYAFLDGHVETLAWNDTWTPLGIVGIGQGAGGSNLEKTPWQVTGFLNGQYSR